MFYPYGPLFCTLISDWLLHISSVCHCTLGLYKVDCNQLGLLVAVNLVYECHKNIGPHPTMSYYIDLFHKSS